MTDLDQLREVGRQLTPPPFGSLVTTARERTRRTRIITTVGALAVMGFGLVLADNGDERTMGPAEAPSPSVPTPDGTLLPDGVRALPEAAAGYEPLALEAGRYHVPLSGTLALRVDLPEGTIASEEGLYLETKKGVLKVEAAGEEYGVPKDACQRQDIDPVGPTVQDLVAAIDEEPAYRFSAPEPVQIGGAAGTYLEIRIPAGYDATSCEGGQVGLPGNPLTSNNMAPGYVGGWWILDVEGQRVVVQQLCEDCTSGEGTDLTELIRGITFTAP